MVKYIDNKEGIGFPTPAQHRVNIEAFRTAYLYGCVFMDGCEAVYFLLRCFGISNVKHQINEAIKDREVRLIDEDGSQRHHAR